MTIERWSVDQLGALADEWMAEREAFLSALHTYMATQLSQSAPAQPHAIDAAVYHAELHSPHLGRDDARRSRLLVVVPRWSHVRW